MKQAPSPQPSQALPTWTGLDHNSDFAAVPKPGTCVQMGLDLGRGTLLFLLRRSRRA